MEEKLKRLISNITLLFFSISMLVSGAAWGQNASLELEKARLVSKFAKFIEWPAGTIQAKFVIGVYEDSENYNYFNQFFENKIVKDKDIVVRLVKKLDDVKGVNILYIPSSTGYTLKLINNITKGASVLIITENSKELDKTMIDISYKSQKSSLVFQVNDANIDNEKLKIPDLSYFTDDTGNGEVLSISPSYIKAKYESELLLIKNQLAEQKALVKRLNNNLNENQDNLKQYNAALQQSSERLKKIQQDNVLQSAEIKAKDKQLKELEKQFKTQKAKLISRGENSDNNEDGAIDVLQKEHEQAILVLTEDLKQQKEIADKNVSITKNMMNKVASITKDNETLASFKLLFYVFVVIALIALILAYIMWKKSKNAELEQSSVSDNKNNTLLPTRENQLIRSENIAAFGYIATDITYAIGLTLSDLHDHLVANDDNVNATALEPVVMLLDNFNTMAADQDDTEAQSFDVVAYMQKMMLLYDFEFSQSDIDYNYSGEKQLTIKSVPSYIALVLLNLINNSLKHAFDNNGNGKIMLNVEKGAKSGVKVTFSDDGKGMSKDVLAQVFTPFFTTHKDRGYVGVGMSTTYDLIKNKLSGDIKIESKEGKGTTIIFTLP